MKNLLLGAALAALVSSAALADTTLTIATVNNGDMIRMQKLAEDFTAKHPDIKLNWVVLEENVLRQRVTTDIATKGGQFDIMTIGTYEAPIWAKQGWLLPLDKLGADYDLPDVLPKIRDSLSDKGQLYAAPFYGESSFTMYRKDLFEKAGLTMPESPTWNFIYEAADKLTDKEHEIYGICLRGKPGWGENMGFLAAMMNSYGTSWFDMEWKPQLDQPEWKEMISDYVKVMNADGPPGASANGFNENLALFSTGKCAIWVDSTVAAGFVTDPKGSEVADKVGFALAPNKGLGKNANWLWAWALAVPAGTHNSEAAQQFISWATSKEYTNLVASKEGWANVPPGTRASLYANPDYLKAAPFAKVTIDSISTADPYHPAVKPVPYVGVIFPSINEYQGIGTNTGQLIAAALTGNMTVDAALTKAQADATRTMTRAGYIK